MLPFKKEGKKTRSEKKLKQQEVRMNCGKCERALTFTKRIVEEKQIMKKRKKSARK